MATDDAAGAVARYTSAVGLELLPYILGPLGSATAAIVQQRGDDARARAARMIEAASLDRLDTWQEEPAHREIFARACLAATTSLDESKIRALSSVLRAVDSQGEDARTDDALVLVDCLAQLDPVHIRAMGVMEDDLDPDGSQRAWPIDDADWDANGVPAIVVPPVLRRLEANGLIYDARYGAYGGPPSAYRLTAAGHECLRYLRAIPEAGKETGTGA